MPAIHRSSRNKLVWGGIGILLLLQIFQKGKKVVLNSFGKSQFKAEMDPIVQRIQREFGIHPRITLTQAAHESAWGASQLTQLANNLFGFTAGTRAEFVNGEWRARPGYQIIVLPTWEDLRSGLTAADFPQGMVVKQAGNQVLVRRPFRKYPSKYESALDWALLISTTPRYSKAYAEGKAGDLEAFANAIKAAGYATDVNYAQKLVRVGQDPLLQNV